MNLKMTFNKVDVISFLNKLLFKDFVILLAVFSKVVAFLGVIEMFQSTANTCLASVAALSIVNSELNVSVLYTAEAFPHPQLF